MAAWWQSLSALDHVLLYIAVPATLILLIQTVLLFAGGAFDSVGDAGVLDALEALSARQKEALWRGFLQDGTQPMEFQWLWDAYREGAVDSLLEWELTLQLTLEALGFAVVNGAGRFTVTGPDGSARSFDLIRGGPAEKLFLKILFPLDKRE